MKNILKRVENFSVDDFKNTDEAYMSFSDLFLELYEDYEDFNETIFWIIIERIKSLPDYFFEPFEDMFMSKIEEIDEWPFNEKVLEINSASKNIIWVKTEALNAGADMNVNWLPSYKKFNSSIEDYFDFIIWEKITENDLLVILSLIERSKRDYFEISKKNLEYIKEFLFNKNVNPFISRVFEKMKVLKVEVGERVLEANEIKQISFISNDFFFNNYQNFSNTTEINEIANKVFIYKNKFISQTKFFSDYKSLGYGLFRLDKNDFCFSLDTEVLCEDTSENTNYVQIKLGYKENSLHIYIYEF